MWLFIGKFQGAGRTVLFLRVEPRQKPSRELVLCDILRGTMQSSRYDRRRALPSPARPRTARPPAKETNTQIFHPRVHYAGALRFVNAAITRKTVQERAISYLSTIHHRTRSFHKAVCGDLRLIRHICDHFLCDTSLHAQQRYIRDIRDAPCVRSHQWL